MDREQPPRISAIETEFVGALIRSIPGIVWLKDTNGAFLTCNASAEQFFGMPESAIRGKTDYDFFPVTEAGAYQERDREAIAKGAPLINHEWIKCHADGRPALLETVRTPIRIAEGRQIGVLGVARDVTALHKEEALRARSAFQEHLERIALALPDAVFSFRLRPDGSICVPYASPALVDVWGFQPEELAEDASAIWAATHPDDGKRIRQAFEESARTLSPWHDEFRVRHAVKGEVWIEGRSIPMREADGNILWHGLLTDITARKQGEADLRSAHSELAAIHAHVPVILMVVDEDLRVRKVNDLAVKVAARPESLMLGMRPGSAIGCLNSLADPRGCGHGPSCDDCPIRHAVLDSLRNGTRHENVEAWIPLEDGGIRERCLLVCTAPMQFDGQRRALLCALDITDRKRAEGSLRESEARFRTLTEGAPIAISMAREGRAVYANPAYVRMFGFQSGEEMLGRPTIELFAERCRAEVSERAQRRAQGIPVPREYEATGLRCDGSEFPMQVAAFSMQFTGGPALVAFITDLTLSKHSEEERFRLEQQLQRAQKLESVGRLAGGVAHDFNNMLTVINGYGDLVLRELKEGDPLRDQVAEIRAAGERAADLTKQLLAFSRKQVIAPKAVNLNHLIDKSRNLLQRLMGEEVKLVTQFDPALGLVMADPGQLHQVLMNLTINARDAMPSGGTLTIETANVELDESYAAGHSGIAPGPFVLLRVSDTGSGIPQEIQERIFDPFFTTKPAGVGTGLGLSSVHGIVRQGGGSISLRSEPGRGAAFDIYLPRSEGQVEPLAERALPAGSQRGTETALIVEDQAEVRRLTVSVLKQCGYRVLEASMGEEAMRVAKDHRGPIHLLLTDVVMPGMSGKDLAECLQPSHPEMKVLYMSGYAEKVIAHQGVLDSGVEYINKPFTPEALALKVRSVLGES